MGEHIIVCVNDVDDQINRRRKNRYHTLLNCQFLPNMNMHEVLHLKCIPMSYTHRIQHMPKSILFFFNSILLCNICSLCARFFFSILSRKVVCVNVFERKTDTTRCGRCALKMKRQIKFIDQHAENERVPVTHLSSSYTPLCNMHVFILLQTTRYGCRSTEPKNVNQVSIGFQSNTNGYSPIVNRRQGLALKMIFMCK